MTEDKANEWLKQVTGKKIRKNRWPEGEYLIPTGEWKDTHNSDPRYQAFWAIDEKGRKDWWNVHNGFEETLHGNKWELLETFDDYLEMYHND